MDRKLFVALNCLLWFCFALKAQTYELPPFYGQYFNDPQVNGIQMNNNRDGYFLIGHQRNGGQFGGVNTSLFAGQLKFGAEGKSGFHAAGLQFIGDKEGFLIRRNRIAGTYARHQRITSEFNFAAGVNLGVFNYAIKGNDVTGGYSSYAFDGSFFLKAYSERTEFGLGVNQAANTEITPVNSAIILVRNLNIYARQRFDLSDDFQVLPSIYSRYSRKHINVLSGLSFSGGLQLLVRNTLMVGLTGDSKNGYYVHAGVEQLKLGKSELGINLSYFLPTLGSQRSNVRRFEVFLTYGINSKK